MPGAEYINLEELRICLSLKTELLLTTNLPLIIVQYLIGILYHGLPLVWLTICCKGLLTLVGVAADNP